MVQNHEVCFYLSLLGDDAYSNGSEIVITYYLYYLVMGPKYYLVSGGLHPYECLFVAIRGLLGLLDLRCI